VWRFDDGQRRPGGRFGRHQVCELPPISVIVTDRWNGFEQRDPNRRQVCWSHLDRDFRRHSG
jgi:hypothetical protein